MLMLSFPVIYLSEIMGGTKLTGLTGLRVVKVTPGNTYTQAQSGRAVCQAVGLLLTHTDTPTYII